MPTLKCNKMYLLTFTEYNGELEIWLNITGTFGYLTNPMSVTMLKIYFLYIIQFIVL